MLRGRALKPPNKAKATRNWECMAVVDEWLPELIYLEGKTRWN
jgi:hypothetical protein